VTVGTLATIHRDRTVCSECFQTLTLSNRHISAH
jgi:hypothetical protein